MGLSYSDFCTIGPLQRRQLRAADEHAARPTAIVCANDVMAGGVIRYLERAGLQVGVDVAVNGYDDTPIAELLGLTSVRQPTDVVAVKVIEMLIGEIQGMPVPRRNVLLEPGLIGRSQR